MHLLQKYKPITSPSRVMEILLHIYLCQKNLNNQCVNTTLLEGIQFVDASITPKHS